MGSTESTDDSRPLVEVFAANVRRLRTDKGLSAESLARRCGYTPEFIDSVEKAQAPELTIDELAVFAAALDVDGSDLVRRDGPR
jgi:transcriptional regulator with XRE-family HTH domain